MSRPSLGVCYYPEHWPERQWADDAQRMAALGLRWVRIGEFAWSRLEPEPGRLEFDWLERAIDTLHAEQLRVVLGTPTATPPKWLVDSMPDMLGVGSDGQARRFGSRRHYCFSHAGYREECARIVRLLAERFGQHPGVAAWQTDNEYGCHDTTLSYSTSASIAFRQWLESRYTSIDVLNQAWGTVFWSQTYRSFDEVDLPNATVTEANPAHRLDFSRFSSDQVVSFNALQTEIVKRHSPGRPVTHNYMGRSTDFDHFAVGDDLDFASWDSYPIGFLTWLDPPPERYRRFARQGDPDIQALHHDLYRAVGRGRWWVMEQQPGPVNWAAHNPSPLAGMVRLWTWEAIAHGAEVVSYFRWRQAPFAQEQMHSALLLPDSSPDVASEEAARVATEIQIVEQAGALQSVPGTGHAALVFDYESEWAWRIQPQGQTFSYLTLVLELYRALRAKGLSVDIVSSRTPSLDGYSLVMIPALLRWQDTLIGALRNHKGVVCIGPRAGSKTEAFQIPQRLAPDLPSSLLDMRIRRVESLPPELQVPIAGLSGATLRTWREFAQGGDCVWRTEDGHPALVRQSHVYYLCGWPNDIAMDHLAETLASAAKLVTVDLPDGVRRRAAGDWTYYFNYSDTPFDIASSQPTVHTLLDGPVIDPGGVSIVRTAGPQEAI